MIGYEVQGRRVEREPGRSAVRDHVRLASADDREAAFVVARAMAAENFTVWVFRTDRRSGRKSYELLCVLSDKVPSGRPVEETKPSGRR